jgi:hypothetical protein
MPVDLCGERRNSLSHYSNFRGECLPLLNVSPHTTHGNLVFSRQTEEMTLFRYLFRVPGPFF